MKMYMVTICYATNNPGEYSEKYILKNLREAKALVNKEKSEDAELVEPNEWDDAGPNWKNLETWDCCDTMVLLDEIDNDYRSKLN